MAITRTSWATDLLGRLGYPVSYNNLFGLVAWELTEGGWFNNVDQYNPLNTTQPEPGSHPTNAPGVQWFPTYEAGMQATVTTLRNGLYDSILSCLSGQKVPSALAAAIVASPWGTGDISKNFAQAITEVQNEFPVSAPLPTKGLDMPASNDYVKIIPGPVNGSSLRLRADGFVAAVGCDLNVVQYSILGNDNTDYTFPFNGCVMYPALPPEDRMGSRYFTDIYLGPALPR